MGDDRSSAREENGLIIYRASALGGCLKALVASRLEFVQMPAPKFIQEKYDAGHAAEDPVVDKLRHEHGIRIVGRQIETRTEVAPNVVVMGHIDGIVFGSNCLLEIKSQGQHEWDEFEKYGWDSGLFPRYKWQISAYFHSNYEFEKCLFVRYNRDTGEISKEMLTRPFYSLAHIRARVLGAEEYVAEGKLPATCDVAMYPCPVFYLHEDSGEVMPDEMVAMAKAYKELGVKEATLKKEKQELRRVLREAAGPTRKWSGTGENAGVKVTFYDVGVKKDRTWYDGGSALATGIGMALIELAKEEGSQERMRITVPKDEGMNDGAE